MNMLRKICEDYQKQKHKSPKKHIIAEFTPKQIKFVNSELDEVAGFYITKYFNSFGTLQSLDFSSSMLGDYCVSALVFVLQ